MAFNVHIVMQPSYISQKSHFVEQNNSLNFTMTFPAQAFKQITKIPSLFFLQTVDLLDSKIFLEILLKSEG